VRVAALMMVWAAVVAVEAGASRPAAQGAAAGSVRDGIYTAEQAKRGKEQFEYSCASCHLSSLEGDSGRDVPALVGDDFMADWKNHSVKELLDSISKKMPGDSPGSLSAATYADIVAYIFQVNKFPSGTEELGRGSRDLGRVKIEE